VSWLPLHSGHPLMVHLPLVAFPLALAVDVLARWKPDRRIREVGTTLWWLGFAGAVAAVGTGLLAYSRVEHSDVAHPLMTLHRNLALSALGSLLIAGLVRWRRPPSWLAVGFSTLGIAGIGVAAYFGGEIVYRHAIGLPTAVLEQVMMERGGHRHATMPEAPESRGADSGVAGAGVDSATGAPSEHLDGPQHRH